MNRDTILTFLKELRTDPRHAMFKKIGLFGSYAKDKADDYSDIDIAVQIDKRYFETHDVWDYFDAIEMIKKRIFHQFHRKSDVFDIESTSSLKEQILKDVIYV